MFPHFLLFLSLLKKSDLLKHKVSPQPHIKLFLLFMSITAKLHWRRYSSVVEHSTSDREIIGSIPVVFLVGKAVLNSKVPTIPIFPFIFCYYELIRIYLFFLFKSKLAIFGIMIKTIQTAWKIASSILLLLLFKVSNI